MEQMEVYKLADTGCNIQKKNCVVMSVGALQST